MTSLAADAAFLRDVYDRLTRHYDIDRWHWRVDTPLLDVCLGAILVQHTAWVNVEKAVENLRNAGRLTLEALASIPVEELALLVRPAGTPLTKARRVKTFVELVGSRGGFEGLFALPADELRANLLATNGIGPETADVILLYGAGLPVSVHDAYTARLMRRLGCGPEGERYATWRGWQDERLPADLRTRQRFHAAVVVHCKTACRVRPLCGGCPLAEVCVFAQAGAARAAAADGASR